MDDVAYVIPWPKLANDRRQDVYHGDLTEAELRSAPANRQGDLDWPDDPAFEALEAFFRIPPVGVQYERRLQSRPAPWSGQYSSGPGSGIPATGGPGRLFRPEHLITLSAPDTANCAKLRPKHFQVSGFPTAPTWTPVRTAKMQPAFVIGRHPIGESLLAGRELRCERIPSAESLFSPRPFS